MGVNCFTGRGLMVSQVVGLVVPFAVRSWWLYRVGLGKVAIVAGPVSPHAVRAIMAPLHVWFQST